MQITHQIQVLTEPLCRAQAIFYSLPNNEWETKYRGLTYSAKQNLSESVGLPIVRSKLFEVGMPNSCVNASLGHGASRAFTPAIRSRKTVSRA